MKKLINTLPLMVLFMLSCGNYGCPDITFLTNNPLVFNLYDANTGENLLEIFANNIYDRDTVRLIDENGRVVSKRPVPNDGNVSADFLEESDLGILNQEVTKVFYLYLTYQDTDTITLTYTAVEDKKCDDQKIHTVSISYNDSLYLPLTRRETFPFQKFFKK